MNKKLETIGFYQYRSESLGNFQSLSYHRVDCPLKIFYAVSPARFARFMSIVIAFAARHDEERKNAEN